MGGRVGCICEHGWVGGRVGMRAGIREPLQALHARSVGRCVRPDRPQAPLRRKVWVWVWACQHIRVLVYHIHDYYM
jgi:hypothetical protein